MEKEKGTWLGENHKIVWSFMSSSWEICLALALRGFYMTLIGFILDALNSVFFSVIYQTF